MAMSEDRENRRSRRFKVDGIHGNMIFSSDINIVNISIDGASIHTTKRLALDREYNLKIKYRDTTLNLKGIVVWSVLSHTEARKSGEVVPVYKAGLRFTNVLNDRSSGLMKFIDDNKTESIERRVVGVRFKVKNEDGSLIDYPYEYHVKKLSLSGMLIETEHVFQVDSCYDMAINLTSRPISLVGRIVNCVEFKGEEAVTYDTGIEFMHIADEDRNLLKEYLKVLEMEEEK